MVSDPTLQIMVLSHWKCRSAIRDIVVKMNRYPGDARVINAVGELSDRQLPSPGDINRIALKSDLKGRQGGCRSHSRA